jgi:hypothetical protein
LDNKNVTLQFYTSTLSYPAWGQYQLANHPCHGGNPVYGELNTLEKQAESQSSTTPEDIGTVVGPTNMMYYGGGSSPPTEPPNDMRNDIVMMSYYRKCSGDRGNICSGDENKYFETLRSCNDRDLTAHEVESCEGPSHEKLSNPKSIGASHGSCSNTEPCTTGLTCFDGSCYSTPADSCEKREYSGTSFEKEFGLKKLDGTDRPADGVCNELPTCSDNPDKYDINTNSGQYLIGGGTCNGQGFCSRAAAGTVTDCADEYNGWKTTDKLELFCNIGNDDKHMYSQNFTCTKPSGSAACTPAQGRANPDTHQKLCDACLNTNKYPKFTATGVATTWNPNSNPERNCCGDDPGAAQVTPPQKGKFEPTEQTCNDYILNSNPTIPENWIDNDCKNGANCADSSCSSYSANVRNINWNKWLGPSGSTCCNTDTQCKDFLTPGSSEDLALFGDSTKKGTICKADIKECDCKPANSIVKFIAGQPYRTLSLSQFPLRTCAANVMDAPGDDRHIRVNVGTATIHRFTISEQNLDGGRVSCDGNQVLLTVYVDSSTIIGSKKENDGPIEISTLPQKDHYFTSLKNSGSVDCLVTVTIE